MKWKIVMEVEGDECTTVGEENREVAYDVTSRGYVIDGDNLKRGGWRERKIFGRWFQMILLVIL